MNPALRIHAIFDQAHRFEDNIPIRDGWAKIFNVDRGDVASVYKSLAQALSEVDLLEREIKSLDGYNHGLYLKYLPKVKGIFSRTNLDHPWSGIKKSISQEVMDSLLFCSERLGVLAPEGEVASDELSALHKDLSELLERIHGSQLKPRLRSILADLVTAALRSIN